MIRHYHRDKFYDIPFLKYLDLKILSFTKKVGFLILNNYWFLNCLANYKGRKEVNVIF